QRSLAVITIRDEPSTSKPELKNPSQDPIMCARPPSSKHPQPRTSVKPTGSDDPPKNYRDPDPPPVHPIH
ncbi:hypothetical protein AVEN_120790-1, partial [Araneus ventricosus]